MNADVTPPCAGQWKLFDSTDLIDHREAARLCATCPIVARCVEQREIATRTAHSTYGPVGTWAGQLVGVAARRTKEQQAEDDAAYSDDEARRAFTAWRRGDTSKWAEVGYRVYELRRNRRSRAAKKVAA